ncbi:hypothetical protein B0H34DRAFT_817434 [Crassisporium funariophilum]|nr:hypothetical protein B0H34DRAFT_817434 [Crassisporium funariophilum]
MLYDLPFLRLYHSDVNYLFVDCIVKGWPPFHYPWDLKKAAITTVGWALPDMRPQRIFNHDVGGSNSRRDEFHVLSGPANLSFLMLLKSNISSPLLGGDELAALCFCFAFDGIRPPIGGDKLLMRDTLVFGDTSSFTVIPRSSVPFDVVITLEPWQWRKRNSPHLHVKEEIPACGLRLVELDVRRDPTAVLPVNPIGQENGGEESGDDGVRGDDDMARGTVAAERIKRSGALALSSFEKGFIDHYIQKFSIQVSPSLSKSTIQQLRVHPTQNFKHSPRMPKAVSIPQISLHDHNTHHEKKTDA